MTNIKLWVDDIRPAPDGWTRAETISEAVSLIERYGNLITHISLDHDISIPVKVGEKWYNRPSPDTFQVVAKYYVQWYSNSASYGKEPPILTTHSSNPEGRLAICSIFAKDFLLCTAVPAEQINRDNSDKE